MKRAAAALCIAWFALFTSAVSAAGLFRAYVSSLGNDANDCTLPHPCRLLPKALTTIASGGEIWMLDSANYNTGQVDIDRSVTILAIPGAIGSVVATGGGDAIFIGTAGIKVALRNLVIVRLGSGGDGIGINAAAEVDIEDCEISNMAQSGIAAFDANAKVRVTSTRLRSNNNGVYARGAAFVSLDHVSSVGNVTAGVFADSGSTVIVSNSTLRNNMNGAYAIQSILSLQSTQSDLNATAGLYADHRSTASASNSSFANNGSYGVVASSAAGEITIVTLVNNTASGSPTGFRVAASGGTGQALMFANGNQCLSCFTMFEFAGAGGIESIASFGNNSPVASAPVSNGTLGAPPSAPFI